MGRKQPWCGKHLYFHLAIGVKMVAITVILLHGSLLGVDASAGKSSSRWRLLEQCVGTKSQPIPAQKALQCIDGLKTQWPADTSEAKVIPLLEALLRTNTELETDLTKKKEIIRILLEQIERIKLIDLEMEQHRRGTSQ